MTFHSCKRWGNVASQPLGAKPKLKLIWRFYVENERNIGFSFHQILLVYTNAMDRIYWPSRSEKERSNSLKTSELRATYPNYFVSKKKIELTPTLDVDAILKAMGERYQNEKLTTIDGVKIDFSNSWVHLRKSNTEPIIRIYTEASSQNEADKLADKVISEIKAIANI